MPPRARRRHARPAPRARLVPALALLAVAALVVSASSVAGGVVRTTDGLVLDGEVERAADGSVTVTTADGRVRLDATRVASIDAAEGPAAPLARELAALRTDDVDGRFRLALRAEAAGAPAVARAAYASVVAASPDHAAARRALGYERLGDRWLTVAEARRAQGLVLYAGAWVLPAEAEQAARGEAPTVAPDASFATIMRTAATGEPALATAAALRLLAVEAPRRVATAKALLADASPRVRAWACAHLALAADESALRPLVFSAVRDPEASVRTAALAAAASFGHDDVAVPFVRALGSSHAGIVANAARALGELGDVRAVAGIVKHLVSHGGGARSVVEFLTKTSYIRDYDVEIAQAANIANPVVGTAVDGMVFDVRVIDVGIDQTVIENVLVDAFNKLTGAGVKDGRGAIDWYRTHATTLPSFPKTPEAHRKAAPTTPR